MKRRTFIGLAGLVAAFGLPLVGKAAQDCIFAGSAAPVSDGPHLKEQDRQAIIKVVGIGGAGGNAVERMIRDDVQGVEFICINTDAQALKSMSADFKLLLGPGLGAGGKPEMGREWATAERERIAEALVGAHLVIITAGMGGGTGTGAAPIIAKVARKLGIRTYAVVTTPFAFEGTRRMRRAEEGVLELDRNVDSLYIIPNEKLIEVFGEGVTLSEAFRFADDVLKDIIIGSAANINVPGLIDASGRRTP